MRLDRFQQQAWDILTSPAARDAFDLDKRADEDPRALRLHAGVRPRRPPTAAARPNWSQRMLLARRLVEAGVRLVTVDLPLVGHAREGLRVAAARLPAALGSGLLRAHRRPGSSAACSNRRWWSPGASSAARRSVNNDAGRDHYPNVFSAALAGGPVQGRPRGRRVGRQRRLPEGQSEDAAGRARDDLPAPRRRYRSDST